MAINLLRRVGHMISGVFRFSIFGVGGIVASLSPFRSNSRSFQSSAFSGKMGNTFVEKVSSAPANDIDTELFHGDVECDANFDNANSGHGRSSRKEYWDRVKCIESITSDLAIGCKCGSNCCHSMKIGTVLRCRAENAERTSAAQNQNRRIQKICSRD